jgi:uncharacterized protein YhbP (UPF0306 family)
MEQRMIRFLQKHHVLTLSTSSELGGWTAHCFYAWVPGREAFVFTTDPETRHGGEMLANPGVSGGIVLETKVIGLIRGIQFTGRSFPCHEDDAEYTSVRNAYLKRFPFAMAAKLDLWILYPDRIKMTDNRLGFGKKLEWVREEGR